MSENINRKLYDASDDGDEALVSQLIKQGGYNVDWRAEDSRTALHEAAWHGLTPVVFRLLDSGWSPEARGVGVYTPLSYAAGFGHLETAKCLLLWGAKIDTQSDYKETPLHEASESGHTDMVQILLQCGANQEIRNIKWKTAEDVAMNEKTKAVFRKYKEKQSQMELLQQLTDEKN